LAYLSIAIFYDFPTLEEIILTQDRISTMVIDDSKWYDLFEDLVLGLVS
jgi:hypothetical protein